MVTLFCSLQVNQKLQLPNGIDMVVLFKLLTAYNYA